MPGIDRTIKDINSAADATDGLEVHTGKAQRAVKQFADTLAHTGSPMEAVNASAENLAHTFAKGLGATVAIAGAKLIIDGLKNLAEEVGKAAEASEKGLTAINKATDFTAAVASAESLSEEMKKLGERADYLDNIFKPLGIDLGIRLAGITDTMRNLADATKGAADASLLKKSIDTAASAKAVEGMTDEQKAIYDLQKKREEELKSVEKIADDYVRKQTEKYLKERYASEDARKAVIAGLKEQQEESKNATETAKESARQELKEREAASNGILNAQKILADSEAKQADSRAKALKEEIDQQDKLAKLYEDRSNIMQKLTEAQDALAAKQGQMAQQAAGLGGTSRGPGQRATSYELGAAKKEQQATNRANLEQARQTKQQIQDELLQKRGIDPSKLSKAEKNAQISPEAVQMEMTARRTRAAENKVIKEGTGEIKKLTEQVKTQERALDKNTNSIKNNSTSYDKNSAIFEKRSYDLNDTAQNLTSTFLGADRTTTNMIDGFLGATDSTIDFTKTTDSASNATDQFAESVESASTALKEVTSGAGAGGVGKGKKYGLDDIYKVLSDTLTELKNYAHAS